MAVRWRVYYDNGETASGLDPADVGSVGVVAIVQPDPDHGRMVVARWDYYCYHSDDEQWYGHDQFGLWDCLTRPGYNRILFGRTIPTEQFRKIIACAESDPDFPTRSAMTYREAAV